MLSEDFYIVSGSTEGTRPECSGPETEHNRRWFSHANGLILKSNQLSFCLYHYDVLMKFFWPGQASFQSSDCLVQKLTITCRSSISVPLLSFLTDDFGMVGGSQQADIRPKWLYLNQRGVIIFLLEPFFTEQEQWILGLFAVNAMCA